MRCVLMLVFMLIAGHAMAFDPTKSSRYPSPDMGQPNVADLIVRGVGANPDPTSPTGPISSLLRYRPTIDSNGNLSFLNGPVIGTYQNGQYTAQPDAIQLHSGGITCAPGATCDVSGMSVAPAGSAATNTLTTLLGRTVHIADFIKPGETTVDAALPRAIAALPATGGKVLLDRSSSCYALTSAPTIMLNHLTIEGENPASGCLTANYDGDTFKVGNGTTTVANFTLRNVLVQSTISKTSGAAVSLRGAYNAHIENLICGTNTYVCLDINGGSNAFMATVYRLRMPSGYIGIRVGNDTGQPADILIEDPLIGSASRAGIELINASGVQIGGGDIINSGIGLLIDPGNGQGVAGIQGRGTFLDTSTNAGLKISPTGTGIVGDSTWTGLWTATNGQTTGAPGVLVQGSASTVRSVAFNGLRSFNNGGEGIRIEGGAYIDINDPQIGFNSLKTSNTYSGIYVAAGISNWIVTGGRSGAGTGFTQTNQQKYGVEIAPGASDFFSVNADLSGNVTGAISNGATGSHQIVSALAAPYSFMGSNFGFGTPSPYSPVSILALPMPAANADAGGATMQMTTGATGQTSPGVRWGVDSSGNGWQQCNTPGSAVNTCWIQPRGGPVALGYPGPATTQVTNLPYIPVMAGTPTGAPTPITGMAPLVIDGTNGKLCAYVNSAWKCATLQ